MKRKYHFSGFGHTTSNFEQTDKSCVWLELWYFLLNDLLAQKGL